MKRATLFMMQLVLAALILTGVTFPALAQESVKTAGLDPDELERFLDEFFAEQLAELNVPGVTITFVQDGEILLSKGYGFANVEEQIPVSPEETVFRIGSVSKMTLLLALPLISTVLTFGVVVVAGIMWWRKVGSVAGRTYYSLIALVAVLFTWFLHYWNLLGFRFG